MSFQTGLMKFVERMLLWGRKREARKHPEDVEKLAHIDEAIADVHRQRTDALDRDIAAKQAERGTLD